MTHVLSEMDKAVQDQTLCKGGAVGRLPARRPALEKDVDMMAGPDFNK